MNFQGFLSGLWPPDVDCLENLLACLRAHDQLIRDDVGSACGRQVIRYPQSEIRLTLPDLRRDARCARHHGEHVRSRRDADILQQLGASATIGKPLAGMFVEPDPIETMQNDVVRAVAARLVRDDAARSGYLANRRVSLVVVLPAW